MEKYFNYGDTSSPAVYLLKVRGHSLIREIEKLGVHRQIIYKKLGRRMGSPMRAHFSQVNDTGTLNLMNRHLVEMLQQEQRPKAFVQKRAKPDYSKVFNDKAVLRAVGEKNRKRHTPWWRRVLSFFV